jgi:alpha-beta hydrolase superfamily lysophospholipase
MDALRHTSVSTRLGQVWITAQDLDRGSAVFLVHGAMQSADAISHMLDLVPNCVLGHLPGHGVNFLSDNTLDGWSKAFAVAAATYFGDRKVILAGESLGALVCLGMARFELPLFQAVVAFEPPLSPTWPIRRAALPEPMATILSNDYDDLISNCRIPVTVVAGSVPLNPEREISSTPSLISADARKKLKPLIVDGGHQLLRENPSACAKILNNATQKVNQTANTART